MNFTKLLKNINLLIIIILIFNSGCSSYDNKSSDSISGKWITVDGPKCEVWFQNWGEYSRLLLLISDTISVVSNPYATEDKEKPYLKHKPYSKIIKQQLKGNLVWQKTQTMQDSLIKNAVWMIDRANPKIKLPQKYLINATLVNGDLKMLIEEEGDMQFQLNLKRIKDY